MELLTLYSETGMQYKQPKNTFQTNFTDTYSLPLYKEKMNLKLKEIEQSEIWLQKGLSDDALAYNDYYQLLWKRVVSMRSNGKSYLQSVVKDHTVASINRDILGGLPSLKGTRIPISTLLACFADEMSIEEICEDYDLTPEQIKSGLKFVIDVLNRPYYEGEK